MMTTHEINLNVLQETRGTLTGGMNVGSVSVSEMATNSTWRVEVVYRDSPHSIWQSMNVAVVLSEASPGSGLLQLNGVYEVAGRVTTVAGAAILGFITFNLARNY